MRISRESWRPCERRSGPPGVLLVTGDTKVVDRGKADGCFINTAGLGLAEHTRVEISADQARGRATSWS